MRKEPPPFDPHRAAFQLLLLIIALLGMVSMSVISGCIFYGVNCERNFGIGEIINSIVIAILSVLFGTGGRHPPPPPPPAPPAVGP